MTSTPGDRPDESVDAPDAVDAHEADTDVHEAVDPPASGVDEPAMAPPADAAVPVRAERWSRRRPIALGVVAVIALLVSFAAGFGVGHDRGGGGRMVDASSRQFAGRGDMGRGDMGRDHMRRGEMRDGQRGDVRGPRDDDGPGMRGDQPRMHDDDGGDR